LYIILLWYTIHNSLLQRGDPIVQKESLVDIVVTRIKNHIAESELRPGDKYLSERELIDELQVSRTVVREALISLQSIGLLAIRRGGIYIEDQNLDIIKEILQHHYDTHGAKLKELVEVRKIIELGALRLLIEKAEDIDTGKLHEINQTYYEAILNKKDTRKADEAFHRELIKATGNDTFYTFSSIINHYFSMTKIDLTQTQSTLFKSHKEHEMLIDMIATRNLAKAQYTMGIHLLPITTYINQLEEL